MNTKKLLVTLALVVITVLGVGAAYAQQGTGGGPGGGGGRGGRQGDGVMRELLTIVAEATGLDEQEIVSQVRDGATVAEIITENGGDVDAVVAQAVEVITTRVNEAVAAGTITQERADEMLADLEANVTSAINGELPMMGGGFFGQGDGRPGQGRGIRALRGAQILVNAAAEATGLDAQEIATQVRAGSTLAEVISANGGDVDAVIDAAVTTATEQINTAVSEERITQEEADEMIASLETTFTQMANGEVRIEIGRRMIERAVVQLAAEQTGLTEQEIVEQYRAGNSLASILTDNGVEVDAFIELAVAQAEERLTQAVENGRLTQEEADARLTQFREELTTQINEVPTPEAQSA